MVGTDTVHSFVAQTIVGQGRVLSEVATLDLADKLGACANLGRVGCGEENAGIAGKVVLVSQLHKNDVHYVTLVATLQPMQELHNALMNAKVSVCDRLMELRNKDGNDTYTNCVIHGPPRPSLLTQRVLLISNSAAVVRQGIARTTPVGLNYPAAPPCHMHYLDRHSPSEQESAEAITTRIKLALPSVL
jgi:hypothetical protein